MKNGLFIVATPIGNFKDITFRAIEVLNTVDYIFCEDTRVTGKLFENLNNSSLCTGSCIEKKSLFVYNDFSSDFERNKIIKLLKDGKSVALVSDAGTPLISDPGFKLVRECKLQNIDVVPVVGASAVIAALSSCGLPTDKFFFYGFLSEKENERKKELEELKRRSETIVLYESPKRIIFTLENILKIVGDVDICVARELTKPYEEILTNKVSTLVKYFNENKPYGEFVIVLKTKIDKNNQMDIKKVEIIYHELKNKLSIKEISDFIVKIGFEYNKKELYNLLVEMQNEVKNARKQ